MLAKYTTEVLSIVHANSTEGTPLNDRIDEAALSIFPIYPIWTESYRATLNHKILRHYLSREIGFETVGRWKMFLETRLFEIMPYYNQLYTTTLEQFDGVNDVDLVITSDRTTTAHFDQRGEGNTSDQSDLTGIDYPQGTVTASDNSFYASDAQKNKSQSSGENETMSDSVGNDNTRQTRKGKSGMRSQAELIKSFRREIINIDMMIIRDLKDLFFTLY